jgi:hypothetical protein
VVQRTLAKAPDARFSSMEELASVLQSLRQAGALQGPRQSVLVRPGSSGGLHREHLAMPMAQPAVAARPPVHTPVAGQPARHERPRSDMTTTPLGAQAPQAAVTMPDPTTLGAVASQRMQVVPRKSRRGLFMASAAVVTAGLVGVAIAVTDRSDEITAASGSGAVVELQPAEAAGSVTGAVAAGGETAPGAAPGSGAGDSARPPEPDQAAATAEQPAEGGAAPAVPGARPATIVRITSTPGGAAVHVQGQREPIGTTPFEYTLPEGDPSATLSVRRDGYRDQQIEIVAGRTEPFEVTLQRDEPEPKPAAKAEPRVERKPAAKAERKPASRPRKTFNDPALEKMD